MLGKIGFHTFGQTIRIGLNSGRALVGTPAQVGASIRAQAEAAAAVCDRLGAEPFMVVLGDRPIALLHLDTFRRIFAGRTIQPTNVYGMARLEVVEDGVAFQADDPSIRPVVATFAPVTL